MHEKEIWRINFLECTRYRNDCDKISYKSFSQFFFNELEALKLLESALPAWLYTYNSLNTSDQDRISPYNIDTISSRQVMRIKKKNQLGGLQGDPVPNSPN